MRLLIFALVLPVCAQMKVGCTPDSMASSKAGSLSTKDLGRWNCYAFNAGATYQDFSFINFSLEFLELHQVRVDQINDIFAVRQTRTKKAIAARLFKWAALIATVVTGTGIVASTKGIVAILSSITAGASKVQAELEATQVTTKVATTGLWTGPDTVSLKPGVGLSWQIYASKMPHVKELGPKILDRPTAIPVTTGGK